MKRDGRINMGEVAAGAAGRTDGCGWQRVAGDGDPANGEGNGTDEPSAWRGRAMGLDGLSDAWQIIC